MPGGMMADVERTSLPLRFTMVSPGQATHHIAVKVMRESTEHTQSKQLEQERGCHIAAMPSPEPPTLHTRYEYPREHLRRARHRPPQHKLQYMERKIKRSESKLKISLVGTAVQTCRTHVNSTVTLKGLGTTIVAACNSHSVVR